jgi:hypothetical protein
MLLRGLEMPRQVGLATKAKQAGETDEFVPDGVVILEVVLEAPLVVECAEAQVAVDFMSQGVLQMVPKTIPVLENALAQIAIVFVVRRLFDVGEKCRLVGELERADAAPVLVRVKCFVGGICRGG